MSWALWFTLEWPLPSGLHRDVLVRRHFRAEALKMIVTAFLFVAVMLFFKSVSAGALLGGFAAAQSAYWLGLLSK